jgi:hypothetical protein
MIRFCTGLIAPSRKGTLIPIEPEHFERAGETISDPPEIYYLPSTV